MISRAVVLRIRRTCPKGRGDVLNAHRIEARIEPENVSSRRLAAKLRFTEEGLLRDWLCVAGEFRSVVMYSLLSAELS